VSSQDVILLCFVLFCFVLAASSISVLAVVLCAGFSWSLPFLGQNHWSARLQNGSYSETEYNRAKQSITSSYFSFFLKKNYKIFVIFYRTIILFLLKTTKLDGKIHKSTKIDAYRLTDSRQGLCRTFECQLVLVGCV